MFKKEGNRFSHQRILGTTLLCLVLAGCIGGNQTVKRDYRFNPEEKKGLGVLSVEVNDRCGKEIPVIHYREAKKNPDKVRALELNKESKGNAASYPKGWFFVQEEDPADYIFTHVSYGKEVKKRISKKPVTFTNGKVAYLGAVTVSIPACGKMEVSVRDQSRRDLATFEKHMKHFKSKYVVKQVINSK